MMMTIPYSSPVFIVAWKAILVTVFVIASLAFPQGCSGFTTLTRLPRLASIKYNVGGIWLNTKHHTSRTTTPSSSLLFAGTNGDNDDSSNNEGEATQTVVQDLMLSTSGTEAHALEVFSKYASKGMYEGQKYITQAEHLYEILCCLDIEATENDAEIVFKYLDEDGDGRLLFNNEFYPWYVTLRLRYLKKIEIQYTTYCPELSFSIDSAILNYSTASSSSSCRQHIFTIFLKSKANYAVLCCNIFILF
jgi:hypothetical protein